MEKQKVKIEQHSALGLLWVAGWLFTIGYCQLPFWYGVLAILVWPYFLGVEFAAPDSVVPPPAIPN